MIDYTKLSQKLIPKKQIGGDPGLYLRVGTVSAIAADGTVTLTLSDVDVPGVNVLGGAHFDAGSVVQVLSYRGSMLILGGSSAASAQPVEVTGSTSVGTMIGTSFTNSLTTTGIHGVAFIAPPSGIVMVFGRAAGSVANAGSTTYLDVEVKTGSMVGSGTSVTTPSLATSSRHMSAVTGAYGPHSVTSLVPGLTPGSNYNAALSYNSSTGASTSSFTHRYIAVLPQ